MKKTALEREHSSGIGVGVRHDSISFMSTSLRREKSITSKGLEATLTTPKVSWEFIAQIRSQSLHFRSIS